MWSRAIVYRSVLSRKRPRHYSQFLGVNSPCCRDFSKRTLGAGVLQQSSAESPRRYHDSRNSLLNNQSHFLSDAWLQTSNRRWFSSSSVNDEESFSPVEAALPSSNEDDEADENDHNIIAEQNDHRVTLEEHFKEQGEHKKKKKTKRKKSSSPTGKSADPVTAQEFLDSVASRVSIPRLHKLLQKIDKYDNLNTLKQSYQTKAGMAKAIWDESDQKSNRKSKNNDNNEEPEISDMEQRVLLEYFLTGQIADIPDSDDSVFKEHVEIVKRARQVASRRLVYWNAKHKQQWPKTKKKLSTKCEALQISQRHQDRLDLVRKLHDTKSEQVLQQEAEDLVQRLTRIAPEKAVDKMMRLFSDSVAGYEQTGTTLKDADTTMPKASNKRTSRQEGKPLSFLYAGSPSLKQCFHPRVGQLHEVAPLLSAFFYAQLEGEEDVVSVDPHVQKSRKLYDQARSDVIDLLKRVGKKLQEAMTSDSLLVATAKETEKPKRKNQDDDTAVEQIQIHVKPEKKQDKPRKPVHVILDSIQLTDSSAMFHDISPPQTNRMIFLDNLPIDMNETELIDLYSRCGPVESVEIFNKRPDLDPGPLTAKQRKERIKRARRSMLDRRKRKWQRPRTPVYATMTFATEEGYQTATIQQLAIFGMVIRRHPVRSIPAERMNRLYLENIDCFAVDLETTISRILYPDVYVSLDIGNHDYTNPTTAEMKFANFETAYFCYNKLQAATEEETGNNADIMQVHWMPTPDDAMKYWKRDVGFDLES